VTGADRPSAWDVLPLVAPDGVLKVRVGVVVDVVCTCKARPVLVRVLDTEYGRLVVSRPHHPPNAELRAAKSAGLWDGGSQQHVAIGRDDLQPGDPGLTKLRKVARARLGYVGWEDFPFWYEPWPRPALFAYGPRCRCHTRDDWSAEPAFRVLVRQAITSGKRTVGINSPARRD